jgi:aspartyl-tRNA synthetase
MCGDITISLERLVMLMCGSEPNRSLIAFPKGVWEPAFFFSAQQIMQ